MKLSNEGKRLIYSFEGLHRSLGDGRYAAYRCPAGVWTIYAGATEGVKPGMIVTTEQGEEMFAKEIAKFEKGVERLVTVELTQNQYDALVSLSYNIGLGALGRSTVLRKLNKGDYEGAAEAFHMWRRGGGRVLPGLVSRRRREAALFLKPDEKPEDPYMPQAVEEVPPPPTRKVVALGASVLASATTFVSNNGLPPPPGVIDNTTSAVSAWQTLIGKTLADPLMIAGVVTVALIFAVPWAIDKWRDAV